jgi:hypothetical protein
MLIRYAARGRTTILVLTLLAASTSCNRTSSPATSPVSAAYGDGFEVVVFEMRDGAPANVRSVPLKEAEQAIAAGAAASIPGDPAAVQKQLSTGKYGDSRVLITVTPLDGGKQQVRVEFHESSRTFVYEYAVDGAKVTPIGSEYRDLSKSKAVRYAGE